MRYVDDESTIALEELRQMAAESFGDLVKAVADIERECMLVDAELHADQEAELIGSGSRQESLWGINLYPSLGEEDWIEFDSMINLRPSFGNTSRSVDDPQTRDRIRSLVERWVRR